MIEDAAFWVVPVLLASAFIGGWVDSVAGGGGMVTIPIMLAVGVPPDMVLGTNKLQASFGSFTATVHYARKGVIHPTSALMGVLWTAIGAAVGGYAVQQLDASVLNLVIPFMLLGIALFMVFTPSLGARQNPPRLNAGPFYLGIGLLLGFYDGFFGPGVGTFWALAFVTGLGLDLTGATGYTKLMNFTSNIVSLAVFIMGGHVLFVTGLTMAVAQILGARLGSGMVVTRGTRFIRPVFIAVVLLTTAKLLYDRLV